MNIVYCNIKRKTVTLYCIIYSITHYNTVEQKHPYSIIVLLWITRDRIRRDKVRHTEIWYDMISGSIGWYRILLTLVDTNANTNTTILILVLIRIVMLILILLRIHFLVRIRMPRLLLLLSSLLHYIILYWVIFCYETLSLVISYGYIMSYIWCLRYTALYDILDFAFIRSYHITSYRPFVTKVVVSVCNAVCSCCLKASRWHRHGWDWNCWSLKQSEVHFRGETCR